MSRNFAIIGVVSVAAAAAFSGLFWLLVSSRASVEARVPSPVDREASGRLGELVLPEGVFSNSNGTASSSIKASWPRFRGADFDNVSKENIPLLDVWPPGGPKVVWQIPLGEGYAGPAVLNGRVYLLDYAEKKEFDEKRKKDVVRKTDVLRCLSLDDGREMWRRSWTYKIPPKNNHGFSRAVPAVTSRYVVSISPCCHVMCCDALTGSFRWGFDLEKDFEAEIPQWFASQCPLIDDNIAVVAPAGKCLMMGIDCETGKVVWQTPNPDKFKLSHSSIIPMTLNGKKMYVYAAVGALVGVSAEKADLGAIVWKTTDWNRPVTAPSPIQVGENRIFMTTGYSTQRGRSDSVMFGIGQEDGQFTATTVYKVEPKVFSCAQQTPVLFEGKMYSTLSGDAEGLSREFACFDPAGKQVWVSGSDRRFGIGPFILADGKILVMNDDGVLTMIRATAERYDQLSQSKVLEGKESWGPMAIVEGRLLVRDSTKMKCLDLRKQ